MKPRKPTAKVSRTTTEKGQAFEKKVATWAKRRFKLQDVKFNRYFKGKIFTRPIEIDVVGWTHSAWSGTKILWFECKDRKTNIKRTDMINLKERANDARDTSQDALVSILGGKSSLNQWDELIFVSTSKFDQDALSYAQKNKIKCFLYDGRTFQEQQ